MVFTAKELRIMDAPTADNEVVLASLGGKPRMPEDKNDEDVDTKRGVPREVIRERAGAWKEARISCLIPLRSLCVFIRTMIQKLPLLVGRMTGKVGIASQICKPRIQLC